MNGVERAQAEEKLPKEWNTIKLGKLTTVVRGSSPRPQGDSRYYGGAIPRLMVADVTRDGMFVIPKIDFLTEEGAKLSRPMKKGDVVMVVSGAPGLPGILAVDACIHDGFVGFRDLDTQIVSNTYLFHYLKYINKITDAQAGGAIFRNLTTDQIKEFDIDYPPLAEQKQIVDILSDRLSTVDKARTATEAQLKAAKVLPAAYLRQVFDSPEAQKWKRRKLGDVLHDIEAGKSLKCDGRPAELKEWGVLKVSAVSWGKFKPEQNKLLPAYFISLPEHEVQAGDLLISRANTTELVGAVVLVEKGVRSRLMLSDKTLRLIPTSQADKGYLELSLRERIAREYIEENGTGTSDSMKNITQLTIRNIPILMPPVSRQIEIAEAHRKRQPEIERVLQSLQSQLATINKLPAALLRQAFNGEL